MRVSDLLGNLSTNHEKKSESHLYSSIGQDGNSYVRYSWISLHANRYSYTLIRRPTGASDGDRLFMHADTDGRFRLYLLRHSRGDLQFGGEMARRFRI